MGAKITAARDAVKPGPVSICTACIIIGGHDLDCIRSVLGPSEEGISDQQKGTLFVTPGTPLYDEALREMKTEDVSKLLFLWLENISLSTSHIKCVYYFYTIIYFSI